MSLNIRKTFEGKVIFITGCTGFLGKVVLEKLLRDVPGIKKIYILVRPKSGISTKERLMKEVFQSPCFNHIRQMHHDFIQYIDSKTEAVEGDIADERLIFNEAQKQELIENCHFVINNAASIDFNLRLDLAIQINYYGPRRLLALCKQCKQLEGFTHVSTAYTNSDKKGGYIEERIYDLNDDPDTVIEGLMRMPVEVLIKENDQLVHPWINTYTFTKYYSERSLRKHRGNIPLVVVRPSIILASKKEPYPGWIDSIAAAGGLTTMVGFGYIYQIDMKNNARADVIPVDYVSNTIIIGSAYQAGRDEMNIIHSSTSHSNQVRWQTYATKVAKYTKNNSFTNITRVPSIGFVRDKKEVERSFYWNNEFPNNMMMRFAKLTRNKEMEKTSAKNAKMLDRALGFMDLFRYFYTNDWCFEQKKLFQLLDMMSVEEQEIFECNSKLIQWNQQVQLMVFGMQKFIFKQDAIEPYSKSSQILPKTKSFFSDYYRVYLEKGYKIKPMDLSKLFEQAVFSERLTSHINQISTTQDAKRRAQQQVQVYLNDFRSQISQKTSLGAFMLVHRIAYTLFDQIIVNDEELKQIKNIQKVTNKTFILFPTFKSIVDFPLISYIHVMYEMDVPFVDGLKVFDNIMMLSRVLRKCGGYFIDPQNLGSEMYQVLLEEMLGVMMKKRLFLEYHIERKRERSGKLKPTQDFIFENYINAFLRNYDEIEDVIAVPITINYDKIYEGNQFPYELLGEEKPRESLLKILKTFLFVKEKQGKVIVKYCKGISMKEMLTKFCEEKGIPIKGAKQVLLQQEQQSEGDVLKKKFVKSIQKEVLYRMSDNLIITVTSMVAAILLESRKTGIQGQELKNNAAWLFHEIQNRKGLLSTEIAPNATLIKQALKYLENFLVSGKQSGGLIRVGSELKDLMMLSYYRNNLVHIFANEACIVASIFAFGHDYSEELGVPKQRILDQTLFLMDMIGGEFIIREKVTSEKLFDKYVKRLVKSGIVNVLHKGEETLLRLAKTSSYPASFLNSLVLAFVESYWAVLVYLTHTEQQVRLSKPLLEQSVQTLAESLFDEGYVSYYESNSLETIGNAIEKIAQKGYIEKQELKQTRRDVHDETFFFIEPSTERKKGLQALLERMTFFKAEDKANSGIFKLDESVQKAMKKLNHKNADVIGKL